MSSLKRHDGELLIDNRASGDPVPFLPGMGNYFSVPTISCKHCGGAWVVNPNRQRPRNHCRICNHYLCDACAAAAKAADYVHRTIDDLTEMLMSGKYAIIGGTVSNPTLIRVGK